MKDHNKNGYKFKRDTKGKLSYNTKVGYLAMWLK